MRQTQHLKIIVAGSLNSGKREFVNAIAEVDSVELINTSYRNYLIIEERKEQERLRRGGRVTVDDNVSLTLYRVFSTLPSIYLLPRGMRGFVVLVDSTDERSFYEARALLLYMFHFPRVPYIVACNKQDLEGALTVDQIRQKMRLPAHVPMMGCISKERDLVRNVLLELLYMILPDEPK
jgi:uncharacterized protein